ncbi:MAG: hypothetical protein OSB03_11885 [Vicinamibacterales bacterium]|nr:hypothetical protein [Vicinamibacterales bacterium]
MAEPDTPPQHAAQAGDAAVPNEVDASVQTVTPDASPLFAPALPEGSISGRLTVAERYTVSASAAAHVVNAGFRLCIKSDDAISGSEGQVASVATLNDAQVFERIAEIQPLHSSCIARMWAFLTERGANQGAGFITDAAPLGGGWLYPSGAPNWYVALHDARTDERCHDVRVACDARHAREEHERVCAEELVRRERSATAQLHATLDEAQRQLNIAGNDYEAHLIGLHKLDVQWYEDDLQHPKLLILNSPFALPPHPNPADTGYRAIPFFNPVFGRLLSSISDRSEENGVAGWEDSSEVTCPKLPCHFTIVEALHMQIRYTMRCWWANGRGTHCYEYRTQSASHGLPLTKNVTWGVVNEITSALIGVSCSVHKRFRTIRLLRAVMRRFVFHGRLLLVAVEVARSFFVADLRGMRLDPASPPVAVVIRLKLINFLSGEQLQQIFPHISDQDVQTIMLAAQLENIQRAQGLGGPLALMPGDYDPEG